MRKLIVLLSFFCLAFGPPRPEIPDQNNSEAGPYETSFRNLGASYGAVFFNKAILFSFRYFFWSSTAGVCYYTGGRTSPNRVELNQSMWSDGSESFREMLIFHELGHCLLGRDHRNTQFSSGRPESIMNSYLFSQRTYERYRDDYLKELYTVNARPAYYPLVGRSSEDAGDCQFRHKKRLKRYKR